MRELLTDFPALKAYLKKSNLKLRDGLVGYYAMVGEKQGFTIVKDASVVRNACNFGSVDLAWVEPNTVFCCEFALEDDIFKHLYRVMLLKPAIAVLLLSGNSKCSPKRVREIVDRTPELKGIEFIILDVTSGKLA